VINVSLFGSAILERLSVGSPASDPNNPFYKVFDNSVGEWLDNFDVDRFHEDLFVNMASGKWLDLHGEQYDVHRHVDESDEDYRERVIQHTMGRLTPVLLCADFGLDLYGNVSGFSVDDNTLLSDNYYVGASDGFICFTSGDTKALIERSFVINEAVEWFVV
jgi:hypothetical protein